MSEVVSQYFEVIQGSGESAGETILVLRSIGQRDFAFAMREALETALRSENKQIVVDLRRIDFCDSVTLGMFVGLQATARKHGGKIRFLLGSGSHVDKMFKALKLDQILEIEKVDGIPGA